MCSPCPVLITGQHRSGSTWVGKTLAASDQLGYIKEPFNPLQRPGICAARPDYWFHYVHDDDPGRWQDALKKTLSFEYDLAAEIESITSIRDTLRMVRDLTSFSWKRWHGRRPLMKDPIALFSSEWIAETFDADVILLIRHPAAFVSSLLRLQWDFPFYHLANQATLMEDHLSGYEDKIIEYSRNKKPLVDQGILLWKIFAQVIEKLNKRNENWSLFRHEDISRDPLEGFRKICKSIGVKMDDKIEKKIDKTSSAKNGDVGGSTVHKINRNSKDVVEIWKNRLDKSQIKRIYDKVNKVENPFYSQKDW